MARQDQMKPRSYTAHRRGRSSGSYPPTGLAGVGQRLAFGLKRLPLLIVVVGGLILLGLIYVLLSSPSQLSAPPVDGLSTSVSEGEPVINLPTFSIIQPPPRIVQDLQACTELCAGRALPRSINLQSLNGPQRSRKVLNEAIETAFGKEVEFREKYPENWPFLMHQTDQFSLQSILSLRLQVLASAQTTPIEDADFLFLALDTRLLVHCVTNCRHKDELPPTIDRHQLKHQINDWLLDTVHEHRGRRPYPSLVLSLALIDHDYEGSILSNHVQEGIKDDVVVLGIEREPWETEDKLSAFEQMPYPSNMHLPLRHASKETGSSELCEWQLKQEKQYLISFAGKNEPNSPNSGQGPHNGFALRRLLTGTLLSHNETSTDISLHFFTPSSSRSELASVHQIMASSTFCLQPPGDSSTRKGFFDSILLGCIPVIFRRGTYERVWKGQVELEELAVILDERELLDGVGEDVVERLRAVAEDVVKAKRAAMALMADRVQYALPQSAQELLKVGAGWTDDAVGMTLKQLVLLKKQGDL